MIYENDKYEIPKEVLAMDHTEVKSKLKQAYQEMAVQPKKKPKKPIKRNLHFNF